MTLKTSSRSLPLLPILLIAPLSLPMGASAQDMTLTERRAAARRALLVERAAAEAEVPARSVRVVGFAWYDDATPVPHAALRLREIQRGELVADVVATDHGEFRFDGLMPGHYLVEMVVDGRVVAVGHPFMIGAGETVATFIRLHRAATSLVGLTPAGAAGTEAGAQRFEPSSASVLNAASTTGIRRLGGGLAASNER